MVDKTRRLMNSLRQSAPRVTPIATDMVLPNHSGNVRNPRYDGDLVNKAYADSLSGAAPEGTVVKSTGVTVGKVLTADGDNTSSWQTGGSGDMTKAVYDSNDDGTVDSADTAAALTGSQASAITANTAKVSNVTSNLSEGTVGYSSVNVNCSDGTNATLAAASTSRAGLLTKAKFDELTANTAANHTQNTDTALGSGCVAADHGTASTDQVVNVCYGTSATPPTASTTTEGTIYIQYTA